MPCGTRAATSSPSVNSAGEAARSHSEIPQMTNLDQTIDRLGTAFAEFKTRNTERLDAIENNLGELAKKSLRPSAPSEASTDRVEVKIGSVTTEIDRKSFRGEILRAADGSRTVALAHGDKLADLLPKTDSAATELGLAGFLKSVAFGPKSDLERKALGEAAAGTGGVTVPTPLAAEVIDLLRARLVTSQAGGLLVPMETQTLKFAKLASDPVAQWRAENSSINESDPGFSSVTLTAKTLAVFFRASRELLEDSSNINTALRTSLANSFAVALDGAVLVGSGANTPTGLHTQAGITEVEMAANGAAITNWTKVLDLVRDLELANAGDISAWVMSPRTARTINGWTASDNQPLQPPPRIASIPQLVTTSIPVNQTKGSASNASSIYGGRWSEVMVGIKTDFDLKVLDAPYATSGQVTFVGWLRADVAVARPAAMGRLIGIIP
jgi:HK97 family phage major capsid protein